MGLLDTLAAKNNAASNIAARGRTAQSDRPEAKVWMNIGYEVEGKFVNLPLGLPIDTMEGVRVSGQNEDWIMLQTARNELLQAIQEAGDKLEPGQEMVLPLQVRIRHVNGEMQIDATSNPLSMKNAGISLVK